MTRIVLLLVAGVVAVHSQGLRLEGWQQKLSALARSDPARYQQIIRLSEAAKLSRRQNPNFLGAGDSARTIVNNFNSAPQQASGVPVLQFSGKGDVPVIVPPAPVPQSDPVALPRPKAPERAGGGLPNQQLPNPQFLIRQQVCSQVSCDFESSQMCGYQRCVLCQLARPKDQREAVAPVDEAALAKLKADAAAAAEQDALNRALADTPGSARQRNQLGPPPDTGSNPLASFFDVSGRRKKRQLDGLLDTDALIDQFLKPLQDAADYLNWVTFSGAFGSAERPQLVIRPYGGSYSSGAYLHGSDELAVMEVDFTLLTAITNGTDQNITLSFNAIENSDATQLSFCCNSPDYCPFQSNFGVDPSNDYSWNNIVVQCPKGTTKVLFVCRSHGQDGDEGACGVDDVTVLTTPCDPIEALAGTGEQEAPDINEMLATGDFTPIGGPVLPVSSDSGSSDLLSGLFGR